MSAFDERGRLITSSKDVEVSSLPSFVEQSLFKLKELSLILSELKITNIYNAIGYEQEIKEIDTED